METNNRRGALTAAFALPLAMAAGAAAAKASSGKGGHDLASRLDAVEAKQQMAEVLVAYARANDRQDEALFHSLFWPESTHKHGGFNGRSADFVNFAMKIVRSLKFSAHHISNISTEVNADQGFTECHYFAHHRRTRKDGTGEEDAFFEGRYIDRFERRDGVWKIIHRRGLSDYSTVVPAATLYADWPAGQHSKPAPDDDYYAMRASFLRGERTS